MRELNGKVAVVTGAGSGIGRTTALELAGQGCRLALCDIDEQALEQVADELRGRGATVTTHLVDVSDKAQVQAFAAAVVEAHGAVHIVVNNAGVTAISSFDEQPLEDFEWVVGVNLWGVVYGCKYFLPHLEAAGGGHIVNLSSVFGILAPPLQTSYAATKFAVRGFSESLRSELAERNIGVTTVIPGTMQTNLVQAARLSGKVTEGLRGKWQETFDKLGTSPELAAKRIVRAIQTNSPRVLVTRESHLADALKRLMPATADGIVARISKRLYLD